MCHLASGKPVIAEHTGPSHFLPDAAGIFRFRNLEEAAHCIEMVAADYQSQSRLAHVRAEEYFDAGKAASALLTVALD